METQENDQNIQTLLEASQEVGNDRTVDDNLKLRIAEGTIRIGSNSRWFEVIVEEISGKPISVSDVVSIEFLVAPSSREFHPKTDQKIAGLYCKNQYDLAVECASSSNLEFRIPRLHCPMPNCGSTGLFCLKHFPSKQVASFHCKLSCVRKHIQGALYIALLTPNHYILSHQISCKSAWSSSMKRKRQEGDEEIGEKLERLQTENISLKSELSLIQQDVHELRSENKRLAFYVHCATDGTTNAQNLSKELLNMTETLSGVLNSKEWKGFWDSFEMKREQGSFQA